MGKVIFLLIFCILFLADVQGANIVCYQDFTQSAKFLANWDLKRDIPKYLSDKTAAPLQAISIDSSAVMAGSSGGYRITGDITKFVIKKWLAGDGQLGGFKSYLGEVALRLYIYKGMNGPLFRTEDVTASFKDNNSAVNIVRISKDEQLFDSLNIVSFGSPTFERTVAGAVMRELSQKVNTLLLSLPEQNASTVVKTVVRIAKVVDIQGEDIFVNTGIDDKTVPGEIFTVFVPGDTVFDPDTKEILGVSEKVVGKIKIAEVKASRFSRAQVVEKNADIKLFNLVKVER
ncbi:MAG: hypothetical protein JNL74_15400 [Fibrobacteres bacterium]|nr:hypothetical protein [Fibrobacterota bacterium]